MTSTNLQKIYRIYLSITRKILYQNHQRKVQRAL